MNPFQVLGIAPTSDKIKIRRAYVEKTKKHHPDVSKNSSVFDDIQSAYDMLINDRYVPTPQRTKVKLNLAELLTGCIATAIINIDEKNAKMIEFRVPPLTVPGSVITFVDDRVSFDVIEIVVDLQTTSDFLLVAPHVVIKKTISKYEATVGINLLVKNFNSEELQVSIPPNTQASKLIYTFPSSGFFDYKTKKRGNLNVVVTVT